MAVQINFFSMIIRKSVLDDKYPGGAKQYRADCPNKSYIEDDYLTRVAYMSGEDLYHYIDEVTDKAPLLTLCTEQKPNNDIMPYHHGFGFFPFYKNDWLEKFTDGLNGFVYLADTDPGKSVLHQDNN